jgi:hypothetical protein
MLRVRPSATEGAVWSSVLLCVLCGTERTYCNDNNELRVHLLQSERDEERLTRRRKKRRLKVGQLDLRGAKVGGDNHGRGVKPLNIRTVASNLLNGIGWGAYSRTAAINGDLCISDRTFERLSSKVWAAGERVALDVLEEFVRVVCEKGQPVGVAADGAWNKCREAMQHCVAIFVGKLPILIVTLEKPVHGQDQQGKSYMVRESEYESSSKGMEAECWAKVADELDTMDRRFRPLVEAVCVDRDKSVTSIIKVNLLHPPSL